AGAFLTVDPLDASAKAADPLSWNRYAYVRGNPLNRVDPTGEDPAESGERKATPTQQTPELDKKKSAQERKEAEDQARLRAELDAALLNPNVQKALHAIRQAENNPDSMTDRDDKSLYSNAFGNKPIADLSHHPGEKPAGAYQFEPGTWKAAKDALGLRDFSAHSQDLAAVWLIKGRNPLGNVEAGKFLTVARPALSRDWGAVPTGPRGGSHYPTGQHPTTYARLKEHYDHYKN
ncbi:MAG: hypothetical protein ABFD84_16895, partial [Candidatus Polarisedimenticolia bacterium]